MQAFSMINHAEENTIFTITTDLEMKENLDKETALDFVLDYEQSQTRLARETEMLKEDEWWNAVVTNWNVSVISKYECDHVVITPFVKIEIC